jgi:nicotinate-nucleotide adenylyltransferase
MKLLGIFGGTFDPIHYGHLRTAFEMLEVLAFDEVTLVPSGDPPHRGRTFATAEQRLEMVRVAVQGQPGLSVDDCELRREGPSYTIDTLTTIRKERPDVALGLIVGMDAFLGLTSWHRWGEILDLAHLVVAHRPGWHIPDTGDLGELIAKHGTKETAELHNNSHGRVFVHAVTQLEIASTEIRKLIAAGRDPRFLMPDAVRDVILESGCYK